MLRRRRKQGNEEINYLDLCSVNVMESIIGKYYWSISLDDIKTQCVPLTVNYKSSDKPLEVPPPPLPACAGHTWLTSLDIRYFPESIILIQPTTLLLSTLHCPLVFLLRMFNDNHNHIKCCCFHFFCLFPLTMISRHI